MCFRLFIGMGTELFHVIAEPAVAALLVGAVVPTQRFAGEDDAKVIEYVKNYSRG